MVKLAKSSFTMNIFEETYPARVDEGQSAALVLWSFTDVSMTATSY